MVELPVAPDLATPFRLPSAYDYISPGGVAEIRQMHRHSGGEITHVRVPPNKTARSAWLDDITEMWFILAGTGLLWIDDGVRAEEVRLVPGRAVRIPAYSVFQYRSDPQVDLIALLAAAPQWRPDAAHQADQEHWPASAPGNESSRSHPPRGPIEPTAVRDLPLVADYAAPDGSEMRLGVSTAVGGVAHCMLPPGQRTGAVRHRSVTEVWYILAGHGELARWDSPNATDQPTRLALMADMSVAIRPHIPFQFRATGLSPLHLLLLTTPAWPGAAEAETDLGGLNAWPE